MADPAGVLSGLRIVELARIGPLPSCGPMMLADHGAEVVCVERRTHCFAGAAESAST